MSSTPQSHSMVLCYYCGEYEGLSSLQDHMRKCSHEWHAQQHQLIPELQRMYPPRGLPSMMMPTSPKDKASIEKYNTYARLLYCQESLNPCPSCLGLFKATQLGEHFLKCNNESKVHLHQQQAPQQQPQQQQQQYHKSYPPSSNVSNNSCSNNNTATTSPKKQSATIQPTRSSSPPDNHHQVNYTPPKTSPSNTVTVSKSSQQLGGNNREGLSIPIGSNSSSDVDKFLPVRESVTRASMSRSSSSQKKAPMRTIYGKPIAYCCHLCGRDYLGVDSLTFHIPQCLEKRASSQKELPKEMRTKAPSAPTMPIPEDRLADDFLSQLDEYNQLANRIFEQSSRVGCKYCGRKFNPEALIVHLRSCEKQAEQKLNTAPPLPSQSLGKNQQQGVPRNGGGNNYVVGKFSNSGGSNGGGGSEAYEEMERAECSQCGRKFALDRLQVHENSCKGSKREANQIPASKILTEKIKNMPNPSLENVTTRVNLTVVVPDRIPCKYCERKFNPDRIEKHESICKKLK